MSMTPFFTTVQTPVQIRYKIDRLNIFLKRQALYHFEAWSIKGSVFYWNFTNFLIYQFYFANN